MRNIFKFLSIAMIFLYGLDISAQSIAIEVGASKHFVPNTDNYEQPNLDIQVRHRISNKIEYHLTYSNVSTYTSYPDHEILPWNGDEAELYSRQMNAIDISWNIIPLFTPSDILGLSIGFSGRHRDEVGFSLCQYTVDGWNECFMYREKFIDLGLNFQTYFTYYFWKQLGISISLNERLYNHGPTTFSINGGVIFKFNY